MQKLIYLGGTSGNVRWRKDIIEILASRGVPEDTLNDTFFNPVVNNRYKELQCCEEAKAKARYVIYYIANDKMKPYLLTEDPTYAYSMVEATMALYEDPERTVIIFDTERMERDGARAAMDETLKALKSRFPLANIFKERRHAIYWLIDQLS